MDLTSLRGNTESTVLFANQPLARERAILEDTPLYDFREDANNLIDVSSNQVVAMLPSTPTVGDVLVGDRENPFLRAIAAVSTNRDGSYTLDTRDAVITDVVREGALRATSPLSYSNVGKRASQVEFVAGSSLTISAEASVEMGITPSLEVTFEDGDLERIALSAIGNLDFSLGASIAAEASLEGSWERDILSHDFGTQLFFIGWLPVWITWELDLGARAELTGNATANVALEQRSFPSSSSLVWKESSRTVANGKRSIVFLDNWNP